MKSSEMKKATKRILAMLLCTSMVLSSGVSASADEGMAAAQEQGHVHTEACYEKQNTGNLICTKAEVMEGHVHGDECYETTPKLTCEQEEHSHDDGCYTTETRDVCNDESEEHTCGDACVETEEVLTCTAEEHSHDDGCYETETNLICGQEEVEAHIHNDECYAWEEKLVCTLSETAPMAEEAAAQETVTEQPKEDKKAEEAVEAEEVNLQNDDETGIKVSVKSTSDVIPEDTKVVVAPMEMDEEYEAALAEAVSEFEVLGYTAYDISLKDAEDEDITLGENKVEVAIDFEELIPEGINAEEVKDVVLVHITTDEEEKLTAETVGTVEITEEKATVEFEADSFSPYVVTYLSETEEVVEETVIEEPVVEDVVLTYTSEDEAYTATVTGTPEVLENVTAFEAVPGTDEEKITALTEQLTAKAAEMQKTSLGFENYEFKFLDAEGNEAVVEGKVKVSLSFAEARLPEAATAENVDAALLETAEEGLEEINGLISAEAGAVKEVVYTTEEPEELILAWSGDVYRTLPNYEDDDVVITLAGTEYALQNVVGFNVTPIKEEVEETKEQYAEVAKQLEEKIAEENEAKEEEKAVVGFLAYDITLVDAEGNELEPQGGVRVSMEYKEAAAPEAVAEAEEAEVTIHHFEEDEKGEVKQIVDMVAEETIEAGVTTTEKAEVEKAEFVTEGFSVFTITWIRTGDNVFNFSTNIKVLVVDGTNYKKMSNNDAEVIRSITVASEGTPPTLYADSIKESGKNSALEKITVNGTDYQFVKMIVARNDDGIIKAKFIEPVRAIQAVKEGNSEHLRFMLDGMGFYTDESELASNEYLAFVYMDGATTTTATYWSEDGVKLGGYTNPSTYNFARIADAGEEGIYVEGGNRPTDAPESINRDGTTYYYRYVAIEQLGKRIIPAYLRYITETDETTNITTSKLQYRLSNGTDGKESEWVDVVDADIRIIYKTSDTIATANTAGVVDIDLFNYNITDKKGDNFGGFIEGLFFGTGWESGDKLVYNQWTGGVKSGNTSYPNLAVQGMVEKQLGEEGYPKLATVSNKKVGSGGSLKTLFDHTENAGKYKKDFYVGLNHLFKLNEQGYYKYDSGENYAYYSNQNGNKNFTIYGTQITKVKANENSTRGDFMPFVPANGTVSSNSSDERAYHLGMTIGFDFIQPEGGKINGNDMIFEFSGDDDVWVFVDGQLVLDIGGMHSEAAGQINFTTGEVTVVAGPKVGTDGATPESALAIKIPNNHEQSSATVQNSATTLKSIFNLSGNTFEENTMHRLEFFYLERGADLTNCAVTFNLQPMKCQDIEVEKEIVNTDKSKYGDVKFTYELFLENSVDSDTYDKIPEGTQFTVTRDGEYLETRTVDKYGRFTLKHGEVAKFEHINNSLKYYVREISMSDDKFDAVLVNGSAAQYFDEKGDQVTIERNETDTNTAPIGYIAQSEKVTPQQAHKVLFQNTCAEPNKRELHIQKLFNGNIELLDEDATFTFKVMLEDRDGNMVPYGSVDSEDLNDGIYYVGEVQHKIQNGDGIISGIKVGETVVIKNIMSGTDFFVEEINLGDIYQVPVKAIINDEDFSYAPSKKDESVKVDGEILVNKDAKITITNALRYDWEIIKMSSSKNDEGEDVPLAGAVFELSKTGKVYIGTSDEDGKILWELGEGEQIETGNYTLKETKAPIGYSLSQKEWKVEISLSSISVKDGNTEIADADTDESGTIFYTVKIENEPLYELPSTGGHGIYTTMLSGFALMLGAAYVWFTSKREEMLQ